MPAAFLVYALPLLAPQDAPPTLDEWLAPGAQGGPVLAPSRDGLDWGLLVRAFYTGAPEEAAEAGATEDVAGVELEDADAYFAYHSPDLAWRISADLDGFGSDRGEVELEDALARWQHQDEFALTIGQFKPRILRSGSVPASELLFRERTFLGAAFDVWDRGVELGGHHDEFDTWLVVSDGANGPSADHFLGLRGEWALAEAAIEDREGARGAPDYLRVLLGMTVFSDESQSTSDALGYGGDLTVTFGPYSFHGEWADLDGDFAREIDVFAGHRLTLGDGQPWAATLSRRLGAHGELGARYQRADEADETNAIGLCASWRPGGGTARFVADLELVDGDTREFTLVSVGVELGSSGLARPFTGGAEP